MFLFLIIYYDFKICDVAHWFKVFCLFYFVVTLHNYAINVSKGKNNLLQKDWQHVIPRLFWYGASSDSGSDSDIWVMTWVRDNRLIEIDISPNKKIPVLQNFSSSQHVLKEPLQNLL